VTLWSDINKSKNFMSHALQGVLLDVDGTLVDSNNQHAQAWVDALAEIGIDVPFDAVRRSIGMGGDKLLPQVAHVEKDSPQGEKAANLRKEIFKAKYLAQVKAFPQTRDLLQRMKDVGLKLVVASSSEKEEVEALLQIAGVAHLIDAMSTSQDVGSSKPAPEPIEVALKKAHLQAEQVLMLGDTPYDIEAAARAQVKTIALRSGGWQDSDLEKAVAIYADPADLLAQFAQSPLKTVKN